jgi:hypothetical protein
MNSPDENQDTPIWGAAAIGQVIGRNERQTFYLLQRKLIDADQLGNQWVSTPRRLLARIRGDGGAS